MKFFTLLKTLLLVITLSSQGLAITPVKKTVASQPTKEISKQFIETMGNKVLSVITNKTLTEKQKEQQLTDYFKESFDIPWGSKFVLGKYGRTASEAEQTRFKQLYESFLIQSYVPRFREYNSEHFKVVNVVETGKQTFLVQTEIHRPHGVVYKVDYHLHPQQSSGKLVVFDIIAEGVSLITTQRSDFSSIIAQSGMKGLLAKLSDKLAKR